MKYLQTIPHKLQNCLTNKGVSYDLVKFHLVRSLNPSEPLGRETKIIRNEVYNEKKILFTNHSGSHSINK